MSVTILFVNDRIEKCQNMIDYGLIELLYKQIPLITSKAKGMAILKVVDHLIQFGMFLT